MTTTQNYQPHHKWGGTYENCVLHCLFINAESVNEDRKKEHIALLKFFFLLKPGLSLLMRRFSESWLPTTTCNRHKYADVLPPNQQKGMTLLTQVQNFIKYLQTRPAKTVSFQHQYCIVPRCKMLSRQVILSKLCYTYYTAYYKYKIWIRFFLWMMYCLFLGLFIFRTYLKHK